MWAVQLIAPRTFAAVEVAPPRETELEPGQVILEIAAAGICGSDMLKYFGQPEPEFPYDGVPGYPIHEIVGYVTAQRDSGLAIGDRVVGLARRMDGMQQYLVGDARVLHRLADAAIDDVHATVVQPVATVLNALARIPGLAGCRAAVIGLGPLGVIFTHALKSAGAAHVTGIDMVDRSDVAPLFGIDELVTAPSRTWVERLAPERRPDVVIEAVGHQAATLADALDAVAPNGHVFAFGVPYDDSYALPFRALFRKSVTLHAGSTQDWRRFLAAGEAYVRDHAQTFRRYVTDVFAFGEANRAFARYSVPERGRLKVVLDAQLRRP